MKMGLPIYFIKSELFGFLIKNIEKFFILLYFLQRRVPK